MRLVIFADGGSRGNPGTAGSGAAVFDIEGRLLAERAAFIGTATNNVAEYTALLLGINAALELSGLASDDLELEVKMDSKLVVMQMAGDWKIKHPDMQSLAVKAHSLLAGVRVTWTWIPREENSVADALANRAMDEKQDYSRNLLEAQTEAPGGAMNGSSAEKGALTVEFQRNRPSSIRAPSLPDEQPTTIYLVRHGRTSLTESRRISGSGGSDPGLSEEGLQDARLAARALAGIGSGGPWRHLPRPDLLVSSPMKRTRETAAEIAKLIGVKTEIADGFKEIDFGIWEDLTNEEVSERHPEELAIWRGSLDFAPEGGEALRDFDARVLSELSSLIERHSGKSIVLVSHVMPIRAVLRKALSADWPAYWRLQLAPASVSIVRFWGAAAAELSAINATEHLERN